MTLSTQASVATSEGHTGKPPPSEAAITAEFPRRHRRRNRPGPRSLPPPPGGPLVPEPVPLVIEEGELVITARLPRLNPLPLPFSATQGRRESEQQGQDETADAP